MKIAKVRAVELVKEMWTRQWPSIQTMHVDKFTAKEKINFGREIWIKRKGRNRKEYRKVRYE